MAVKDYSTTPDLNTRISGINIAEGCAPSGINNAIRQLMADVKTEQEAKGTKLGELEAGLGELDSSVVHKTGDETVMGVKTFMTGVVVQDTNMDVTTSPSTATWFSPLILRDKNSKLFFCIQAPQYPSGENLVRLLVGKKEGGSGAPLTIGIDSNGKEFTRASTPDANSNNTSIATTEWVRSLAIPKFNSANNSYTQICGGKTSQDGGTVEVYGVGHTSMPGAVVLTDNGDTPARLVLVNAGITHGGKNLIKSINGITGNAVGDVSIIKEKSWNTWFSNYVLLAGGLLLQWGAGTVTDTTQTVTLPHPFSNANYKVFVSDVGSALRNFATLAADKTYFTLYSNGVSGTDFHWFAIGNYNV